MALWLGALTQGLALIFLGWGIYLSFRVLSFADITVDGSFTLGAVLSAVLVAAGVHPALAVGAGLLGGAAAGAVTGLIHTWLRVSDLLAGILTLTALYSITLRVMGRPNVSLLGKLTLPGWLQKLGIAPSDDVAALGLYLGLAVAGAILLSAFLKTDVGLALRATGDNPEMITAQGVDISRTRLAGLALANALVGFSGALIAQYQGFADIQMGIGSLVAGIAAVMIGESFVGRRSPAVVIAAVAGGSILFRLLIALALRLGLNPVDLKLVTAVFVLAILAAGRLRLRKGWKLAPRTGGGA